MQYTSITCVNLTIQRGRAMNIQQNMDFLYVTGVRAMYYKVFYITKWLKVIKLCGEFQTLCEANNHINWLQNKLPNGNKIAFKIHGISFNAGL